jgi:hypothetical protein
MLKFNSTGTAWVLKISGFLLSIISGIVGYIMANTIGNPEVAQNPTQLILFMITNCIAINSVFGESSYKKIPKIKVKEQMPNEILFAIPKEEQSLLNLYGSLLSFDDLLHLFMDALLEKKDLEATSMLENKDKLLSECTLAKMDNIEILETTFTMMFLKTSEDISSSSSSSPSTASVSVGNPLNA